MYKPLPLLLVSREQVENSVECVCSVERNSDRRRKYFSMQMPGQVGAINQKRTNRGKYRLRDWLVGNEIKSPACK